MLQMCSEGYYRSWELKEDVFSKYNLALNKHLYWAVGMGWAGDDLGLGEIDAKAKMHRSLREVTQSDLFRTSAVNRREGVSACGEIS